MSESERRAPRLVALCMLGCLLFNYPILALFNVPGAKHFYDPKHALRDA